MPSFSKLTTWAQGYEKNFMLNSAEHEILNAHKYKKKYMYKKIQHFSGSDKRRTLFFLLINVKMPILTFLSRENFMLSRVEHEIFLITSGPG